MSNPPRRILVTGAQGFVGGYLTAALAAAFPAAALFTSRFDLADTAAVEAAVRTAAPDSCIHLGAVSTIAQANEDQEEAWRVNLHGSLHLAAAILTHAPAGQLVFASTAEVYGASFRRAGRLDETAALAPANLYAATKAAADLALGSMAARGGLRLVRLRPVNHTGPGQGPDFVVPAFARQVARIAAGAGEVVTAGTGKPVIETGNLAPRRDFLDVRDVCAAYVACVARRDAIEPGTILNIGSGEARRIGDVLEALKTLAGVTAETRISPARTRSIDIPMTACDPARAHEVLGWAPAIPWDQTLRDVLDDWRHRIATGSGAP